MQAGLFMGSILMSSQLFGQMIEKRGELPVCPVQKEKSDAPKNQVNQEGKQSTRFKVDPRLRVPAASERKESR